jgi:hypothetical protein
LFFPAVFKCQISTGILASRPIISIQLPAVREKRLVGPAVAILADQIAQIAMRFVYSVNFDLRAARATSSDPARGHFAEKAGKATGTEATK